jgi:hypothetical protein
MLEMYQKMRQDPNFAEAAMVINSAAHIYCRKVDYLEQIIMEMYKTSSEG